MRSHVSQMDSIAVLSISCRFRDIDTFSSKIACFPTSSFFDVPYTEERPNIST